MRIKIPTWLRPLIHQYTFEKRAKSLSQGLLYTYWTSELDKHVAYLMHPNYRTRYRDKHFPVLWRLAEHFFESATEDYPLPKMFGRHNVGERLEAMRSIFNVYEAYCEVYGEPPETSLIESDAFRAIIAEIVAFDPTCHLPEGLLPKVHMLK
ncbi:MAG: hypothetical protein RIA09_10120 [Hoeflea sp.]|uniref:hypothetical protein n=1 Tax=Hoeflea sp. TaxID=1940281 RepID=UPI0032EDF059